MLRACEPRADDRARRTEPAVPPGEVLARERPSDVELDHARAERAVLEDAGREHLARMRARGSLEAWVVAKRRQAMRRAHAVQVTKEARFGTCQAGGGGGGEENEDEQRRDECREPLSARGGS